MIAVLGGVLSTQWRGVGLHHDPWRIATRSEMMLVMVNCRPCGLTVKDGDNGGMDPIIADTTTRGRKRVLVD